VFLFLLWLIIYLPIAWMHSGQTLNKRFRPAPAATFRFGIQNNNFQPAGLYGVEHSQRIKMAGALLRYVRPKAVNSVAADETKLRKFLKKRIVAPF